MLKIVFEKDFKGLKRCKISKFLELAGEAISPPSPILINIVSKQTIETVNNKYMGRRGATDVISFRYDDKDILGEIYISPYIVKRNAKRFKQRFCIELYRVIIHGILHVLGYNHSKKMFALQEKILDNVINKLSSNTHELR